jgi:hypothetical protein
MVKTGAVDNTGDVGSDTHDFVPNYIMGVIVGITRQSTMQKIYQVVCGINFKWIDLCNYIIVGCPDNEI